MTCAPAAQAQNCTGPAGVTGDIIFNNAYDVFQGCTLRGWMAFHKPQPDCPEVGDTCGDGTIYAGVFNGYKLYTPPSNQSAGSQWKIVASGDDIASDSTSDGAANSAQVPDSTTYPAFKLCKDLAFGGHSDWYLPARAELTFLYAQLKAGKPNGTLGFTHNEYWASTETPFASSTQYAWVVLFSSGSTYSTFSKTHSLRVRCVRRL